MAHDLTAADVRALAAAIGLHPSDDDVDEVMHRLNAMRDALTPLSDLPLDSVEPSPPTP